MLRELLSTRIKNPNGVEVGELSLDLSAHVGGVDWRAGGVGGKDEVAYHQLGTIRQQRPSNPTSTHSH